METINHDMKKTPEVFVLEKDVTSAEDVSSHGTDLSSTRVDAKKKMPWLGLIALFVVMLTSIGQLLILLFSDASSASDWPDMMRPNVCLSILNSVSTLAITFAVTQGIAIAWWRRATMGASIKELHYTWSFSTSISSIFLKYKYFNVIALAALMTKVAIVDGVLFQRSTATYIDISWNQVDRGSVGDSSVFAYSQTDFPITGVMAASNSTNGQMSYDFSYTVLDWINIGYGVNYIDVVEYCYGVGCLYGLPGAGFAIDCNETTQNDNFVDSIKDGSDARNLTMFSVDFNMLYPDAIKNYSRLEFNAKFPTQSGNDDAPAVCPTNFTSMVCELRPAVLNYTVAFTNTTSVERSKLHKKTDASSKGDTSMGNSGSQLAYSCQSGATAFGHYANLTDPACSLYDSTWKQLKGVNVNRTQDLHEPYVPGANSSLLGIYNALKDSFAAEAILGYTNGSWSVTQSGLLAPIMMGELPPNSSYCNFTYDSPQTQVLERLNTLMLQASVRRALHPNNDLMDANDNLGYNQNQNAQQFFKDIYYSTDFRYCGAALGLTLFVILCILPSYWGFWQLGRDVTLGPFEIAYAFQGPAFSSVHGSSGQADEVVRTVGRTRVQYGEVEDESGRRLAFRTAPV